MEANELRIGNLVSRTNKLTKEKLTIELTASCILDIYANGEMSSFIYDPIKTTKEWLLKFGFYENRSNNSWQLDTNMGFSIWGRIEKGFYIYADDEEIGNTIYYIHQLQNIYFALTQTELTIKS